MRSQHLREREHQHLRCRSPGRHAHRLDHRPFNRSQWIGAIIQAGGDEIVAKYGQRINTALDTWFTHDDNDVEQVMAWFVEHNLAGRRFDDVDAVLTYGDAALHIAMINNQLRKAQTLIDAGADIKVPGEDNYSPLDYAILHGHADMADLLLTRCSDY